MAKTHSFHIPVMGIGFSIDTPLKVSQYGIDSVVSLVDDVLLEKLRKVYCDKFEIPYKEISEKVEDFRANRITSYLNLMNNLAKEKFEEFKTATAEKSNEVKKYFSMLPDTSSIKEKFKNLTTDSFNFGEIGSWIKDNLSMGSIDVNIMTKLDKENYKGGEKLPSIYNDAHSALRGYANSDLTSSIVLSAGMNPKLYGYLEEFEDFFPNEEGEIKKKIILKVSDYRSALIQGKYLAKRGIWVSEYRIESGLNCGGHAFATNGFLMGPILEEFKKNREELTSKIYETLLKALSDKNRVIPNTKLPLKITTQGGVGTAEEHKFLIDHYRLDSVGWGTPFLLVPEACNTDKQTMKQLMSAKEEDVYLSNISPLGVLFNNLKGNSKDKEKEAKIEKGLPGSSCPKKCLASNKEFTDTAICTASRQYQYLKIKELKEKNLELNEYNKRYAEIVDKSCICVGLGTPALTVNHLDTKVEGNGTSVCPSPNIAHFSKEMSLREMVDHIYGRGNVVKNDTIRPNMFVKELNIYIDYLKDRVDETKASFNSKQEKYFSVFEKNLNDGIDYYQNLFSGLKNKFTETKTTLLKDLESSKKSLQSINWLELKLPKIAEDIKKRYVTN